MLQSSIIYLNLNWKNLEIRCKMFSVALKGRN